MPKIQKIDDLETTTVGESPVAVAQADATISESDAQSESAPSPDDEGKKGNPKSGPKIRGPYRPRKHKADTPPDDADTAKAAQAGVKSDAFYHASGYKAALFLAGILPQIAGPEWTPQSDAERAALEEFCARSGDYFVAKKFGDLPPGWALLGASLAYVATLAMAQRNQGFLGRLKAKFWKKSRVQ